MTQGEVDVRAWYQRHRCLSDKESHVQAADTSEPAEQTQHM